MAARRVLAALLGRRARLRWAYLILGGALMMPFFLLTNSLLVPFVARDLPLLVQELVALLAALPLVAVTGLFPIVRVLEGAAVRALLGVPAVEAGGARVRGAAWFLAHVVVGGVVSGMTLAIPPAVVVLLITPFAPAGSPMTQFVLNVGWWSPALAVVLAVGLVCAAWAGGLVFVGLAPALLGPSPADRVAELERRAAALAHRNRLARELHDSVGHALSVVTIQAAAAERVLTTDPAFAATALAAIGESARGALDELDHVLGLLREDAPGTAPQPDLGDLGRLLAQTRLAGVEVAEELTGSLGRVPAAVSREAYRIVQEGLTNVLRHAGQVPARLRLTLHEDALELELTNPLGTGRPGRDGGGRGLRGVAERVAVLRGGMTSGADGPIWRLTARLPLKTTS
ncbi:hypothetical protein F0L68_27110 [Solihabitans fulvus]|uniref:histidine kinase n=1 Tax=Solihabitans fulvus TaxID=1892852 RepID=A0A5B2WVX0_9PSEU|nr:histidine kinase [Solihabitans fulvus]KAA2256113.1 hypothetical protein F0L68_27110 [Solihabitans fulvus]